VRRTTAGDSGDVRMESGERDARVIALGGDEGTAIAAADGRRDEPMDSFKHDPFEYLRRAAKRGASFDPRLVAEPTLAGEPSIRTAAGGDDGAAARGSSPAAGAAVAAVAVGRHVHVASARPKRIRVSLRSARRPETVATRNRLAPRRTPLRRTRSALLAGVLEPPVRHGSGAQGDRAGAPSMTVSHETERHPSSALLRAKRRTRGAPSTLSRLRAAATASSAAGKSGTSTARARGRPSKPDVSVFSLAS
jgi:hypothetical protein